MKTIALVVVYMGEWPLWFPAFLKSCELNPTVDWIFFTDCNLNNRKPNNVRFIKSDLLEIQELAKSKNLKINLSSVRKICDFKPLYGFLFDKYLTKYDYWGFCDVDIIWGDIRKYITHELLNNYDIITSLENMISGHFTIIKNTDENANLFKFGNKYESILNKSKHLRFDEVEFSIIINELNKLKKIKVFWNKQELSKGIESVAHQEYYLDKWQWNKGKMIDVIAKKEVMYLHFINWKRTMKKCEVKYLENPTQFYISYNGVHYQTHSKIAYLFNGVKNFFNGYWVREKRRYRKLKFKSLVKRVKRKLNINF